MKDTGNLMNYLMGNNSSIPVVGKGATILHWTDRSAYEVMNVSSDLKTVVIRQCRAKRIDTNAMSESQEYDYSELSDVDITIVWKYKAWREVQKKIMFTEKYFQTIGLNWHGSPDSKLCFDNNGELKLIDGKTHVVTKYNKINILWGVKQEYYDFSF